MLSRVCIGFHQKRIVLSKVVDSVRYALLIYVCVASLLDSVRYALDLFVLFVPSC